MDLHLAGKVAVVTGASKGIGLAITRGYRPFLSGYSSGSGAPPR
jgi:hypothetical protein